MMIRTILLPAAMLVASGLASQASQLPHTVIVHDAFGGQILGYDIDQNGSEGVLSEWTLTKADQGIFAIETFDQKTGKVKVIKKIQQSVYKGDFVTLGVVGTSIGLVEQQHSDPYIYKTTYDVLDPLSGNQITGHWTPKLRKADNYLEGVGESQGSSTTAVLGFNINTFLSYVVGANVTTNATGPIARLTNPIFSEANYPVIAMNTVSGDAIVAAAAAGLTFKAGTLAIVDLSKGSVSEFTGLGEGQVNGVGVDSADNIACTTTETDWSIEFYNLSNQIGTLETLEGGTSDLNSGADVQFDSVNKLFLIDQQVCAGQQSEGCIQVYDTSGNWVETAQAPGFNHIAFNPNTRTGFLWLNDNSKFDELQSFTY